jgi:putative heme transporter
MGVVSSPRRRLHPDVTHRPRRLGRPWAHRRFTTLVLLLVLAGPLLASVPGLQRVVHRVGRINPWWVVLALALEVASELGFVVMFQLFIDRGNPRDLRRMAWTELASGALIPGGGAGGLAIGGWLMYLAGAPTGWVLRRSEALFFVSGATSALGMILPGLALILGAPGPHGFLRVVLPTAIALLGTGAIAAVPWIVRARPHPPRWLRGISSGICEAEKITFNRRSSWRLLGSVGYLGFDMAVLYVALSALVHPPSVPTLMLAYTIGYAASSLPVPGGIGVLDAGLTGALVLYGVS